MSDWGALSVVVGAVFGAGLLLARFALDARRGRLASEREVPAFIGVLAGVGLVAIAFLGSLDARLVLPIGFMLGGLALLVLPDGNAFRYLSTRSLGWGLLVLGGIGLAPILIRGFR